MSYIPEINHYVIWKDHLSGWIYFKCENYITIETVVRPKIKEDYKLSKIHANNRLLVLCYREDWKELKYIKSRKSIYEEEKEYMEILGESTWGESIKK